MKTRFPRRMALLASLLILPSLSGAAQTAPPPQQNVLRDRVLAVVDEDPILASDVDRVLRLGLMKSNEGEADAAFRRRVLNSLIEERLRFHEIDRYGFEQVPVEEIEAQVARIRQNFPDDEAFRQALREVGLDSKGLRQLVARQLLVLAYVDERLGARVFVSLDEISKYYRNVLTPEMQRRGQTPPPLEEVREEIREVLKQQKLNQELEKWTEELRGQADIVVHAESPDQKPLPPVVKRIEKKAAGG
ncbi:MAG: SurA N-terminal domain-containing protein [Thermoanaerobaculia bacterium]